MQFELNCPINDSPSCCIRESATLIKAIHLSEITMTDDFSLISDEKLNNEGAISLIV